MADEAKTRSIREKFGTDFLIGASDPRLASTRGTKLANESVERALAAYGHKVLETLERSDDKIRPLFDIVDATGMNIEVLSGVVDRMANSGMIEVVRADKYGNHDIRITPLGEKML
jgi:predicted transcriptional regulator